MVQNKVQRWTNVDLMIVVCITFALCANVCAIKEAAPLNTFQIKLVGSKLCLQPVNFDHNAPLIVNECDDRNDHIRMEQLWIKDEHGRLLSAMDEERCLETSSGEKLVMGKCNLGNASRTTSNKFSVEKNEGGALIRWQHNELEVFSVFTDEIATRKGAQVQLAILQRNGNNEVKQYWKFRVTKAIPFTYKSGDLSVRENGLLLSKGLTSRIIARSGQSVQLVGGGMSKEKFHQRPDGASIFEVTKGPNKEGWLYVSNSETLEGGGVGMVTFNKNGEVIDYGMIVTETQRNCGGGKTPWNTWVTCEENKSNGQIYEVDPFIGRMSQQKTILGGGGGNYESFGFDARDPKHLTFYVTTDSRNGGLLRFTPDSSAIVNAQKKGNYGNVLTSPGLFEWLVLDPVGKNSHESSGKFRWTLNKKEGDRNAKKYYPFSEGIDTRDGLLFFTCKKITSLFILNLDEMTYTKTSTKIGKFDGQPDTIVRVLSEDDRKDMLYFCEDGPKTCGIHARNKQGNFFHILEGEKFSGQETTGLAFSPDNKRLYVCFQDDGIMFEVSREDGYAFDADSLDVR